MQILSIQSLKTLLASVLCGLLTVESVPAMPVGAPQPFTLTLPGNGWRPDLCRKWHMLDGWRFAS
jgi:hypothetical protein